MKTQNKTIYIWLVMILTIIGVLSSGQELLSMIIGFGKNVGTEKTLALVLMAIILVDVVVSIIYVFKLNTLKLDVLRWTNIIGTVGLVHLLVLAGVSGILNADIPTALANSLGGVVITVVIWVAFYRHLKKELGITKPVAINK